MIESASKIRPIIEGGLNDRIRDAANSRLLASNTRNAATKPSGDLSIFDVPNIPVKIRDDKCAADEWRRCVKLFKKAGIMMKIYQTPFMLYCMNYSLLIDAYDALQKRKKLTGDGELKPGEDMVTMISPNGHAQMSNEFLIFKSLQSVVRDSFDDFGMTPKAITKVGSPKQLGFPFN